MTTQNESGILLYGTQWCGDCLLARLVLNRANIQYQDIDITSNPEAEAKVMELNGGNRTVPTILFPDGSILIEPSRRELQDKLTDLQLVQ